MPDLPEMSRVLYCHNWQHIERWASAIDELADLTDGEILELQRLGAAEMGTTAAAAPHSRWFRGWFGLLFFWSLILKLFGLFGAPQAERLPAGG